MAFVVDVDFDEVAEEAELEEGGGGRATEGVDGSAEEAELEEGGGGRALEGVVDEFAEGASFEE